MNLKLTLLLSIIGLYSLAQKGLYDGIEEFKDPANLKGPVKEVNFRVDRLDTAYKVMYLKEQKKWTFDREKKITSLSDYQDTHYSQPARVYTIDEMYHYKGKQLVKKNQFCKRYNLRDSVLYEYDKNLKLQKICYAKKSTRIVETEKTKIETDSFSDYRGPQTLRREYALYNGKFRPIKETPGDGSYNIERTYSFVQDKMVKETFSHTTKSGSNDYRMIVVTMFDDKGLKIRDSVFNYQTIEIEIPVSHARPKSTDPDETGSKEYPEIQKKEFKSTSIQNYSYDSAGNITSMKIWDLDNKRPLGRQEIKYDSKGNWTEVMFYFMNSPDECYIREILYY